MKQPRTALLLALVLLAVSISPAWGQSGGPYDLTWNTVHNGGYSLSIGGDYTLSGTIGQPGSGLLTGGDYTLLGGFWSGASSYKVYLSIILRKH